MSTTCAMTASTNCAVRCGLLTRLKIMDKKDLDQLLGKEIKEIERFETRDDLEKWLQKHLGLVKSEAKTAYQEFLLGDDVESLKCMWRSAAMAMACVYALEGFSGDVT